MKKLTLLLVLALVLTTVLASCNGNYDDGQVDPGEEREDYDDKGKYEGYTYKIHDGKKGKEIEITEYDFENVEDTASVTLEIPAKINNITVTKIGRGAFEKNSVLRSVVIPEGVKEIDVEAFWYNYSLESVTLPESLTAIGKRAFSFCSALKTIEIPAGITAVSEDTFYECTSLESVTFKGNITSIGSEAFRFCGKLASVALPATLETIGDNAFAQCAALTTVTFAGEDASVITIGEGNDVIVDALGIVAE